jgi:hypothetical protein
MIRDSKDRALAPSSDLAQRVRISGRRSARIPMRVRAALILGSGSDHRRFEITTVDFSEHGLGIAIGPSSLFPGQIVQVILAEDLTRAGRYRVVWVGPAGSARSGDAGIEFLSPAITQF